MSEPLFPLAVWQSGTNENSIPANDNALRVEVLMGPAIDVADAAPVGPAEGDQYVVGTPWSGFTTDNVVIYKGGTWLEWEAYEGWVKVINGVQSYYDGSDWVTAGGGGSGDVVGPSSSVNDRVALFDGTTGKLLKQSGKTYNESRTQSFVLACSDETTAITAGTGKARFRLPYAFTLTAVRASLTTAQASGSIFTVDVNEGGVSILSTKLTIDNTETTSTTAATPPVISDSSLADDAEISVDVDQIGASGATGLKVTLIGYPT